MIWRVGPLGRVVGWASFLIGPALVVVGVSAARDPSAGVPTGAVIAAFGLMFSGLGYFGSIRPRIEAMTEQLIVRNPWKIHRLNWNDIHTVVPGYSGIIISMNNGNKVTAWAVQKSNLATWRSKLTRADAVVAQLRHFRSDRPS
jgi:hypothetical protein